MLIQQQLQQMAKSNMDAFPAMGSNSRSGSINDHFLAQQQQILNRRCQVVRGIGGIVLLFPFYAGIMGMMMGANADGISLGRQITEAFISWSSADTFPLLAFLSAGVVNVFVPSGGGQWAVQGPIMLPAGAALAAMSTRLAVAFPPRRM